MEDFKRRRSGKPEHNGNKYVLQPLANFICGLMAGKRALARQGPTAGGMSLGD